MTRERQDLSYRRIYEQTGYSVRTIRRETLIIEIANQEKVPLDQICPDCGIEIQGQRFDADLLSFNLGGLI